MKSRLLPILLLGLAACSAAAPSPTAEEFEPLSVLVSPSAGPMKPALFACAALKGADSILIEEGFPSPGLGQADLVIQFGEPEEFPHFTAALAAEGLAVAVHPDNPISTLTDRQMQGIFSGQIRGWGKLGGDKGSIQIWSLPPEDESSRIFSSDVMDGARIWPEALIAPTAEIMAAEIAKDPLAIGFLPLAWRFSGVKVFPLNQRYPILALAEEEPQGTLREFVACLQGSAGQSIMARLYSPWQLP
ncbi:MAG: substrate-binding domain-containing protein [Anaerolineae bacterium]|nr:substrate-binding domain-containing protein [Anaerolineae bacterium]